MVFSSHLFLFYFLPAALLLYYASSGYGRLLALTLVSLLFYGWANPWFIPVVVWTALLDYCCGGLIAGGWRNQPLPAAGGDGAAPAALAPRRRRWPLALSVAANLGMLAFFKYTMFAEENLARILHGFGHEGRDLLVIVLPIGISFYTFESISYVLDIYRGNARPASFWVYERYGRAPADRMPWLARLGIEARAFLSYLCYLTQFPHLVAGPIIRYRDIERQLHQRTHTLELFARGVAFFSIGLAKKVLLANPMGEIADAAFAAAGLPWQDAWFGAIAYAFQIYCDFSGYSDMAIGLGLMMGFRYPRNFRAPYLAESITEFWRRWHISLSTWLRDYLYLPLGGNRRGRLRTYANLLLVMLIGGFWHGAAWTFLAWGAIHGVMLATERTLGKTSLYSPLPKPMRIAVTFLIVCLAWVFFRSPTLGGAGDYLLAMSGLGSPRPEAWLVESELYDHYRLLAFAACALVIWGGIQTWEFTRVITPLRAVACALLLATAVGAMWSQAENPFLYFRF
jgi:alginate O-acetyltransferase complex protein AlgI